MKKGEKERLSRMKKTYAAGAAALAALIAAAFFAPQLIFGLQDSLRSRDYRFDRQETQDVMLLNTSYERSLYNRLSRFAEDTQKGVQMYVTCQDMTPDQALDDFLHSEAGLWQAGVTLWADTGLFPYSMLYDSEVTDWKQYVIYSDDYTKGVNFIIWYVEVENKEGAVFRILLDADSGALYGISSDYTALAAKLKTGTAADSGYLAELLGVALEDSEMAEYWAAVGYYCAGLNEKADYLEQMELHLSMYDEGMYAESNAAVGDGSFSPSDICWSVGESENGRQLDFTYTYGTYTLDFRLAFEGNVYYDANDRYGIGMIMDAEIGFPAICELIPAFYE